MLKATELRIGNYFYSPKYERLFTVSELGLYAVTQPDEDYTTVFKYDKIVGIPLTPEVLEKCGFNHKSNNEYVKDNLVFRILQNDLILHGFEYDYNGVILNRPESLHQLQNLYFALTGTELEYKP